MSEKIQIYQKTEFGNIRTMRDEKVEPLFCAKDVCDALGYKRVSDAISGRVEEEDTVKCRTLTNVGAQLMLFINESGLYSLILSSKLEAARRFKHWVTSEVLPSIRKQGGYMVLRADESDEVEHTIGGGPAMDGNRNQQVFDMARLLRQLTGDDVAQLQSIIPQYGLSDE